MVRSFLTYLPAIPLPWLKAYSANNTTTVLHPQKILGISVPGSLMPFRPRSNGALGERPTLAALQESTLASKNGLSPEVIVSVAFGITMVFLALLAIWQTHRRTRRTSPGSHTNSLHTSWVGLSHEYRRDTRVMHSEYIGLYPLALPAMMVPIATPGLTGVYRSTSSWQGCFGWRFTWETPFIWW